MKSILYRVSNKLRYTLCGTCDKGVEWEYERDYSPTHTLCYCYSDTWFNLTRQFIKRKTRRRKNEPIFTDTESTS